MDSIPAFLFSLLDFSCNVRRGQATAERFAKMKRKFSRIRGFFIFGGFVFLLTLFLNGAMTMSRTGHFFTPTYELSNRLPFSIVAGLICGLLYAFFGKRNNDA